MTTPDMLQPPIPSADEVQITVEAQPEASVHGAQHVGETMLRGTIDALDTAPTIDGASGAQHVEASEDLTELRASVSSYFDTYMDGPRRRAGNTSDEDAKKYQDKLTDTAVGLFDRDVLERARAAETAEAGSNPLLKELADMITSIDHNAGVYYTKDDVEGIFGATARKVFADSEFQQQLHDTSTPLSDAVKNRAESLSSLEREKAIALVKTESGEWVTADARLAQAEDFTPLELMRQDSGDKGGWNKYRRVATRPVVPTEGQNTQYMTSEEEWM